MRFIFENRCFDLFLEGVFLKWILEAGAGGRDDSSTPGSVPGLELQFNSLDPWLLDQPEEEGRSVGFSARAWSWRSRTHGSLIAELASLENDDLPWGPYTRDM